MATLEANGINDYDHAARKVRLRRRMTVADSPVLDERFR